MLEAEGGVFLPVRDPLPKLSSRHRRASPLAVQTPLVIMEVTYNETPITANRRQERLVEPSDQDPNPDSGISCVRYSLDDMQPHQTGAPPLDIDEYRNIDIDNGDYASEEQRERHKVIIWCEGDYRRLRTRIVEHIRRSGLGDGIGQLHRITRENETRFEISCRSITKVRQLATSLRSSELRGAGSVTIGKTFACRQAERAQPGRRRRPTPAGSALFLTVNVSGVRPNFHTGNYEGVCKMLTARAPHVVALTETWLQEHVDPRFDGYHVYSNAREWARQPGDTNRGEGGVAVLLREDWDFKVGHVIANVRDTIFLRGTTSAGRRIAIGCFYAPQSSNRVAADAAYAKLSLIVERLQREQYEIVLMGDFNAWTGDPDPGEPYLGEHMNTHVNRERNDNGRRLVQLLRDRQLLCLNGRSTARPDTYMGSRVADQGSVLDLILASGDLGTFCKAEVDPDHGSFGGHFPVFAEMQCGGARRLERVPQRKQWNISKLWAENRFNVLADEDASVPVHGEEQTQPQARTDPGNDQRALLASAMANVLPALTTRALELTSRDSMTAEEMEQIWSDWAAAVEQAADRAIGRKKPFKHRHMHWNMRLTALWEEKRDAEQEARARGGWTRTSRQHWRSANMAFRKELRRAKREIAQKRHEKCEQDRVERPRTFWKTIKRITGERSIPHPLLKDGELTTTAEERVAVLKEHYDTLGNQAHPEEDTDAEHSAAIEEELAQLTANSADKPFMFTVGGLEVALKKCKLDKAAGPDDIPMELLKFGGKTMLTNLVAMFNMCVQHEMTPLQFKTYNIYSLWKKKGSPNETANYRGISLLNTVGKLYVRVITNKMQDEIDPKLRDEQAGFRPERSTEDQIIILKDLIDGHLKSKEQLNILFVDFKAAYDRVWRPALWTKMYRIGVNPKHIKLMRELYSRVEATAISGAARSAPFTVNLGVRQGCVASPFLFSVFVNDLIEELAAIDSDLAHVQRGDGDNVASFNSLMFADDLSTISRSNAATQKQCDVLSDWAKRNRMTVHSDKTKLMIINAPEEATAVRYRTSTIEVVDLYRYLGLLFSSNGNWNAEHEQRLQKAREATSTLGAMFRSRGILPRTKQLVWNAKVRPMLEYGAVVFNPKKSKWAPFEAIQHEALTKCLGVNRRSARSGVLSEFGARSMQGRFEFLLLRAHDRIRTKRHRALILDKIVSAGSKDMTACGYRHRWRKLQQKIRKHHGDNTNDLMERLTRAATKRQIKQAAKAIMDPIEQTAQDAERAGHKSVKDIRKVAKPFQPEPYTHTGDPASTRTLARVRVGTLPLERLRDKQGKSDGTCPLCKEEREDLEHFLLRCSKLDRSSIPPTQRSMAHLTGGSTPKDQLLARTQVHNLWRQRLDLLYPNDVNNGNPIAQPTHTHTPTTQHTRPNRGGHQVREGQGYRRQVFRHATGAQERNAFSVLMTSRGRTPSSARGEVTPPAPGVNGPNGSSAFQI
eukprot:TRINITY_DN6893_c0_g1_i1.p1 TRINITY_DN6893_c0_g1~~TRINITY_DN6893_c0_g1_i1.p1  ORF type:complete len:1468 (+),score=177.74 TRINITY_DN6893_c0_g1_i1:902-5305(+)